MTPTMARCPHSWPIRECTECAPPSLFTPTVTPRPDDDPYGITLDDTPPPVVVTIAIGGVTVTAIIVLGGVAAAAWAVGALIDTLKPGPAGRSRP